MPLNISCFQSLASTREPVKPPQSLVRDGSPVSRSGPSLLHDFAGCHCWLVQQWYPELALHLDSGKIRCMPSPTARHPGRLAVAVRVSLLSAWAELTCGMFAYDHVLHSMRDEHETIDIFREDALRADRKGSS